MSGLKAGRERGSTGQDENEMRRIRKTGFMIRRATVIWRQPLDLSPIRSPDRYIYSLSLYDEDFVSDVAKGRRRRQLQ